MRVDLNLPWSCENGASEIIDADGGTAAYALSSSETPHIVKAVNNHDALVKLAKEVLICVRDEDDFYDLKYEARKILAKLEI